MKKIILAAFICLYGLMAYAQEEKIPFVVSPQYPTGGDEVTMIYDNSMTTLAESKEIKGVIYICDGEEWIVDDLALIFSDGVWRATYTMPENAVLAACKFYGDGDAWDSGSAALNSYGLFVYGMNGDKPFRKLGTWMQRSLLFSKSLDKYAIPGYLKNEYKVDDKETFETIRWEGITFPQMGETLVYYIYKLMESYEPGQHNNELLRDIKTMLTDEDTKEISLVYAAELARTILKDNDKAAEIEAAALKRFPDGLMARDGEVRKIFMERDPETKFQYLEEFVERFPPAKFTKPQTNADGAFYTRMFWFTLREVPEKFYNLDVLVKYLPLMPASEVNESYFRGIALPYKHKTKSMEDLRLYGDAIYAELIKRINGSEDLFYSMSRNERYSPLQWRNMMLYNYGPQILTHAKILQETGSPDKAIEALESMKEVLGGKISDFNDLYSKLLAETGYPHLVVPFIEESIRLDAATPEMLDIIRADFTAKNPSGDFDKYLNGLRSDEYVAKMEEKLLESLIKKGVEPFKLKDMNGEVVDMAQLKGKILVLDFWATWCTPCIAALPGMKMAVDRYKNNPDVEFYFICTLEYGPGFEEFVPGFMESKGYDFNVLYDDFNDRGRHGVIFGKYASQFGMSGIPQKMIIDKEGYVRWVSGGYHGNPLELANEVSFMVDYLLNEK